LTDLGIRGLRGCLSFPAIRALEAGYAVEGASGATSDVAHLAAMLRTMQAGVIPVTLTPLLTWRFQPRLCPPGTGVLVASM
jgi:hypothetical protein